MADGRSPISIQANESLKRAPQPTEVFGDGEEIWRPGPGGFTLLEEGRNRTPYGERFLLALAWWTNEPTVFMECYAMVPAQRHSDTH